MEEKVKSQFIGFIGLNLIKWEAPCGQSVEVGWRLGSQYWNKGYATEGARACLQYGFNQCGLQEIVAFTVLPNIRSARVMEKIGMIRDLNGDFAHPNLPLDHRLSKHILYRIRTKS